MGSGRGVKRRTRNASTARGATPPPCESRGWRFFLWPKGDVEQEFQVGPENPLAHLFSVVDRQVGEKIMRQGVAPLQDIDLCFADASWEKGEDGTSHGGCVVNDDERLQLMVDASPEIMDRVDYFLQILCHEYCHALFTEAFFKSYSQDGKADYSLESKGIVERVRHGDKVASEALADAFAFSMHSKVEFGAPDDRRLLSYDELMETDKYADAYSLKRFLCSYLQEKRDEKTFIYNALRHREQQPEWGMMQCLQRGFEDDTSVNPEGRGFRELYEDFRAQESDAGDVRWHAEDDEVKNAIVA